MGRLEYSNKRTKTTTYSKWNGPVGFRGHTTVKKMQKKTMPSCPEEDDEDGTAGLLTRRRACLQ